MLSPARVVVASAVLSSCLFLAACGDEKKEDPSSRIRVSALSTEASSLEGPAGSSLIIPAGASETDVTIVLSAPRTRRSAPADTTAVSDQFRLEPEGKTFVQPLELTIPITPSALPAGKTIDDVIVVRAPQGTGEDAFIPVPTRREGDAVVATTEHFSDFLAIVIDDGATPFGTCGDSVCLAAESCGECPYDCNVCLPSADVTPPAVTALVSPSSTTNVAGNVVVQVQFDGALLANSVSPESFRLVDAASNVVAGTFTIAANGLVDFRPTNGLAPATVYTLTIVGLRDAAGNLLTAPYTASFTTGTAATITTTSPTSGDVDVDQATSIALVFDAPFAPASLIVQPLDGPCTGTFQVSTDDFATCYGGTLAFGQTNLDLSFSAVYPLYGEATAKVRFAPGALSANGFQLGFAIAYSFVVETDVDAPYLVSMTPTVNSTGVPIDIQEFILEFSEPVDPATFDGNGFIYGDEAGSVDCDLTFAGGVVTCRPLMELGDGRSYAFYLFGVADLATVPNVSSDDAYYYFYTETFPYVYDTHPREWAAGVHPRADIVLSFSEQMDEATLTIQPTDGPCTGTIQLTDGTTCYGGAIVEVGEDAYAIRATTSYPNSVTMTYSVEESVTSLSGNMQGYRFAHSFIVSPTNDWAYPIHVTSFSGSPAFGVAEFDNRCSSGGYVEKALVIGSARHPCTTSWCGLDVASPVVDSVDWVLEAGRTYIRDGDGLEVFTTDAVAPIPAYPGTLAHPFRTDASDAVFGGTADWLVSSASSCLDFTNDLVTNTFTRIDLTSTSAIGSWGSTQTCNNSAGLVLCVEQANGASRATH